MAAQLLLRNVPSALALKFLLTDSFLAVIRFCHGFTLFGNVEVSLNPEMDFKEPSELRKISKERTKIFHRRQSAQDAQRQVVLDVNQEVAPPVLPAPPQGQRNVKASSVYLPHYKRAANTSRHCIYTNCGNAAMHLIPKFI
ncbi:hypothetical protein ACJJTC_003239 [Scirpophaga incertulas]